MGDKAVDELVSQAEAARVDQAAPAIATAHRLSKAAADQQDAARVAKAGADVDAAGNVSMSDDDFEDDDDPLNLQKQYLEGCPRPELKRLATEAGLNLKGNAKKPTLVKSLLAHYTKLVAQVGYTNPTCLKITFPTCLKMYLCSNIAKPLTTFSPTIHRVPLQTVLPRRQLLWVPMSILNDPRP